MVGMQLPVQPNESIVLGQRTAPGNRSRPQVIQRSLLKFRNHRIGIKLEVFGQLQEHRVRGPTAQALVIGKEEHSTLQDGPAQTAAELVIVERIFRGTESFVDRIVGIHGLITIEPVT